MAVLEPRGLCGTMKPESSIEALVSSYLGAIKNAQKNGPYYLLGHSFGGSVAFEMARVLEQQGHSVYLIMCDSILSNAGQRKAHRLDDYPNMGEELGDSELISELQLSGSTRNEDDNELLHDYISKIEESKVLKGITAVYEMQVSLFESYKPSGTLRAETTLIYGEGSNYFTNYLTDVLESYKYYCETDVSVYPTKGGHFSMFCQEHIKYLVDTIQSAVESFLCHE